MVGFTCEALLGSKARRIATLEHELERVRQQKAVLGMALTIAGELAREAQITAGGKSSSVHLEEIASAVSDAFREIGAPGTTGFAKQIEAAQEAQLHQENAEAMRTEAIDLYRRVEAIGWLSHVRTGGTKGILSSICLALGEAPLIREAVEAEDREDARKAVEGKV